MEFKTLKNIEISFKQIRLFTIIFLGICACVTIYAIGKSFRFAELQRQKIYVLDQGKSLILALAQDAAQNRPVEAKEHVRGRRTAAPGCDLETRQAGLWRPSA